MRPTTHTLLAMVLGITTLVSCKKDDNDDSPKAKSYAIEVNFIPQVNGNNFDISNDVTTDPQGRSVEIEKAQFYLSNIKFVTSNGDSIFLKDIALVDLYPAFGAVFSPKIDLNVAAGDFSAISFDLGVDPILNAIDPAQWESDHPLSVTHGMYWDWDPKFIFSKLEGRVDSTGNGTTDVSWFMHNGTDPLYRPGIAVNRDFSIAANGDVVNVYIDISRWWTDGTSNIDLVTNGQTHTMNNPELARDITNNLAASFQ